MAWWPGEPSPQMSPQRLQHPGQYPMPPRMYPGAHPPLPMMGMQQMQGVFPGARPYRPHPPPPPHGMGSYAEGGPSGSQGQQQQSGYNCEVGISWACFGMQLGKPGMGFGDDKCGLVDW